MSQQDKVIIKIESSSDTKAIDQTKTKVKSLSGQVNAATQATSGFRKAMSGLNQAMGGFGAMAIVAKIGQIIKAFDEAREAQQKLIKGIEAGNAAAGVDSLKRAYDQLRDSIQQANDEAAKTEANFDKMLDADRRLADAQLSRREAEEIAGLDAADPENSQKAAAIRARYALTRAQTGEGRAAQDADRQAQRNQAEIARRQAAIAQMEADQQDFIAAAGDYQQRAAGASALSQRYASRRSWYGKRGYDWNILNPRQRREIDQYATHATHLTGQSTAALQSAAQIQRQIEAEQSAISGLQAQQPILAAQRRATAAEASTTTYTAGHASSSADAAVIAARTQREAAARARAQEIAAKEAEAATARQSVSHAQSQLATGQHAISSAQGVDQLRAANAAYANSITTLTSVITDSLAQAKRLEAEVDRLKSRQSASRTGSVNLE